MRFCLLLLLALLGGTWAMAQPGTGLPLPPDSLRAVLDGTPVAGRARAEALLRVANAFMTPFDSAGVVVYAEAAERVFRYTGDTLGAARARGLRGEYYRQTGDLIRAAPLLLRAERALATGPTAGHARALYWLGMLYGDLDRIEQALTFYRRAYQLFGVEGEAGQQGQVLNSTGLMYRNEGQYDSAAAYLFRAARIQHRLKRSLDEAAALGNIALLLYDQKRYAQGLKYARRAYELELAEGDTVALASTLDYLGAFALKAGDLRLAHSYFQQSLNFRRRKKLGGDVGTSYANLGTVYQRMGRPDSAAFAFRAAVRAGRTQGRPAELGAAMGVLAQFYEAQFQFDSATYWAEKALALSKNQIRAPFLNVPLRVLRQVAEARGDFPRAYELLQRERSLEVSQQARDNERVTEEVRVGYELEQTEQQVQLLTLDQKLASLRRRDELTAGGAVLVVLGGLGLFYWRTQRRRLQMLYRASQRKDLLMSIVGHDLRGLVAGFQQVGPLLRTYAEQPVSAEELLGLADELETDANHFAALLDNLLHWARAQTGDVINYPQTLQLAPAVADAVRLYQKMAAAKQIVLELNVAPDLPQVWVDPALLATVLRNLMSNAVKFTPYGGRVTVEVTSAIRLLTVMVTDTGPGLSPPRLETLFEPAGTRSTPGTAGETGTGLGLAVSHAFVKLFAAGDLHAANTPDAGARFWFNVPVAG